VTLYFLFTPYQSIKFYSTVQEKTNTLTSATRGHAIRTAVVVILLLILVHVGAAPEAGRCAARLRVSAFVAVEALPRLGGGVDEVSPLLPRSRRRLIRPSPLLRLLAIAVFGAFSRLTNF
jgi:hypothetical protein